MLTRTRLMPFAEPLPVYIRNKLMSRPVTLMSVILAMSAVSPYADATTYNVEPVALSNGYAIAGGFIETNGTIGQLMEPMTPVPDWLVVDEFVLRYVLPSRQSTFLLLGFDGRPSGYVTVRDLSKVGPDDRLIHPVRRYAASLSDVPVVASHESARAVLTARQAALRSLLALVVEDGVPVGIVTRSGMTSAIERARLLRSPRPRRD